MIFDDVKSLNLYYDIIAEPANRATMSVSREYINVIEKSNYRTGTASLQFLEENHVTYHLGIVFRSFSPFFETFNEAKGWLESNGWMERFRQRYSTFKRKPEELGPQVLTMDHLNLGFLACLIVAAVSLAAFIGELMWSRLVTDFRRNMQKVFEEKREIATRIISIDEEICGNVDENNLKQDDLIELQSIGKENSMVLEGVESVVDSKMCSGKLASNHPEPSKESFDDTDSIDRLIESLNLKAQTK